jgi:soluble lytic murein transglycosylase
VKLKTALIASALLITSAAPALAAAPLAPSYSAQLGPNAKALYQAIFASIKSGQWSDASAKLDAMQEGPLHAVARAELYLAKGSPKVEGNVLAALAEKASDLPQAQALVRLAAARGVTALPSLPSTQELGWLGSAPRRTKVAGSQAKGVALAGQINPLIKNDQPNEAEAVLDANAANLDSETLTEWQHRIAWTYYLTGDDVAARRLAAKASMGYGDWAAQADWVLGLSAWRQKDWQVASDNFAKSARRTSDKEMAAAGHFWAARADMAGGHPDRIDARLKNAARDPETFYGLLALQQLGLKARPIDQSALGGIEKRPNVRAALALSEIGELDLADDLIRYQARIGDARDHAALATIAGRMDLPATQLWLAHNGPAGAQAAVSARYPNPKGWQPAGGWRIDRSLVFAHALQESQFRTNVTSHAGARGLMQVLPGTAAMIARSKGPEFHRTRSRHERDRWSPAQSDRRVQRRSAAGGRMERPYARQCRSVALHRIDPLLGNPRLCDDSAAQLLDVRRTSWRTSKESCRAEPGPMAALSRHGGRERGSPFAEWRDCQCRLMKRGRLFPSALPF